jgi:F420-dependent oxidoreductase-like protein
MRFGLQLGGYGPSTHGNHWDTMRAVVQACEAAGLDSVWVADHFMFPDENNPAREVPIFDCMVMLGAIAAATSRVKVGQLVIGVPYRNPALLAKMCTTLDVISHGRSIVGLGAAWHEPEFRAYGWPFPPVKERMQMLEEAIQIVDRMMTMRPASFEGQHYQIKDAYNDPMPVQKPRPPIMIGGDGERVTLRLVAQYADFCNVFGDPATVRHKYEVLQGHCEAVGRPYEQVTRSNHISLLIARDDAALRLKRQQFPRFDGLIGTPDTITSALQEYIDVGTQYITFTMPDSDNVEAIQLFGETVVAAFPEAPAFPDD